MRPSWRLGSVFVGLLLMRSAGTLATQEARQPRVAAGASIDAHIEALTRGDARGPLRVEQGELNAWLRTSGILPLGIEDVALVIAPGAVRVAGRIDADRYKDQLPPNVAAFVSFISGPVPVALAARLETAGGQGRVLVDALSIGGLPFPTSLIAPIVAAFTKTTSRPEGFDITQPFDLPVGVDRVRLEPGVAWLDIGPPRGSSR